MLENKQNVFSSVDSKKFFILGAIVGILVICAIGFFILLAVMLGGSDNETSQNSKSPVNSSVAQGTAKTPPDRVEIKITETDHIKGNKNAPVKIVEFSDYQCPFCQRHHATMQQVMTEYGEQVAWVYKHFPLDTIHANARPAAEASECVWEQKGEEGFWSFTDSLFNNQSSLGSDLYNQLAQELGVNMSQFEECISSHKYRSKVEANYQEGVKTGVRGTPGNFINGIAVDGAVPFTTMKQIIDSELN